MSVEVGTLPDDVPAANAPEMINVVVEVVWAPDETKLDGTPRPNDACVIPTHEVVCECGACTGVDALATSTDN